MPDPTSDPASDPIAAFFSRYPPDAQAISWELRAMVRAAMPGAHETLYERENHTSYGPSAARRDVICYICPLRDYVRLGFMYGLGLPDPAGLLIGEGKRLRHVKVRSLEAARQPALRHLVEATWAQRQPAT